MLYGMAGPDDHSTPPRIGGEVMPRWAIWQLLTFTIRR
jgi:hypothetical protein